MLEGPERMSVDSILALADGLKTPLLRLHMESGSSIDPQIIQTITEHALRDIDAFIAAASSFSQIQLNLETVALGSIMKDVSERIRPYARISRAHLVIDDHSSHQPVYASSAVVSLGLEMIAKTMCDLSGNQDNPSVVFRADTRHGYPRLGVYRSDIEVTAQDVRLAQLLLGGAKVNAGLFQQLGALRIAIASQLLSSISLNLRSAKSNGSYGLGLQLVPSTQMGMF